MCPFVRSEKRKIYHQKKGSYTIALPKWWLDEIADYYGVTLKELKEIHVIAIEDILILSFRNKKHVFEVLRELGKQELK